MKRFLFVCCETGAAASVDRPPPPSFERPLPESRIVLLLGLGDSLEDGVVCYGCSGFEADHWGVGIERGEI